MADAAAARAERGLGFAATDPAIRRVKLLRPRLAADAVDRPRLLAALDRGLDRPLVLLSGPAGSGKTTLLGQWLAARDRETAWLTLDDRDDAAGALAHLVAAVQTHRPGAGRATLGLLRLPGAVAAADLGASLADELAALPGEVVVVLDDLQEAAGPGVADFLAALLHHPPPPLRLVVASRVDPALPLARLRSRGQLLEVRAADLRFTAEEAAAFLARALPDAPPPAAARLIARTEGWAAGLRLAALALPPGEIAAGPGGAFAAGPPALDYLFEEVLDRQPAALQAALLRVALPERLCAPLADALLEPAGAPGLPAGGSAVLRAALQANVFLSPLDEAPAPAAAAVAWAAPGAMPWYRFHPLFRDLLLRQGRARLDGAALAALHARAGAWFGAAGMVEDGMAHYLAAGDGPGAGTLVERHIHAALAAGAWPALERWLDRVPPAVARDRPALLLARAWVAVQREQYVVLPPLVAAAQARLAAPAAGAAALRRPLEGEIAALTMIVRYDAGDAAGALEAAAAALAALPEEAHSARATALAYGAQAALVVHGVEAALRWPDAGPAHDPAAVRARMGRGIALLLAGELPAAARTAAAMVQEGEVLGLPALRLWGHVLLGAVHYEWNDPAAAEPHLRAALREPEQLRLLPRREAAFALALVLQAQARPAEADAVLDRLETALLRTGNATQMALVAAFRVRLALLREDAAPARAWLAIPETETPGGARRHLLHAVIDAPPLTRAWARLRLAGAASGPAAGPAADLLALATTAGRMHLVPRRVQALALLALAQDASGEAAAALDSLSRAVDLGERSGLVRTFLDLGPPLAGLLRRLAARRAPSAYINRLLGAGARPAAGGPGRTPAREPAAGPTDPLTAREREVLARLAQRWSNKEIAAALHVSPETVKRHAATVYGKLGVSGRREAVQRATELGLLPGA